ncbi:hypothetical protein A2230_08665 [candidate division WOR-1 bacterium RIFOXYA2_FULL_36_21]|uniref:Outer membrane protein beta-barrel domain-containing protein n=1 Tax=candidate division WOR-1 bacterium RIFOXYB2_FULL_36_35 TaxID=1802578 RepID=A0A1F4RXW1_UNCSA|nr:MAG: hypothetical protein A2230_08665 [candidate division WOR-1 bacterium RIFOXYA2_FULL_36_21]OGC13026.1 MAG: hypothetical protein A2290_00430 [candidate division WOR-1 bacterium RIFOXYB2_FULL_36_35]OGC21002.1 MAG: hypothetical protein A2282_05800 [candidate division WOR-1 bacterium RIFOXYA12_FULL_36_13]
MKKISFILILLLASGFVFTNKAIAESKVVKKTIKKVIQPEIAPVEAPETESTEEALPELSPPPPPPQPEKMTELPKEPKGVFGWGTNADITASYLYNLSGQQGLFGTVGLRGDIIFSDPLKMGEKFGLSEDAVEYKVGLGYIMGSGTNDAPINAIPLFADAIVYLKEGSLNGADPFVGAGLNINLIGRDGKTGGLGGKLYGGILADLGLQAKTEFSVGYESISIGNGPSTSGIVFFATQPLKL